ncbi:RidA family protein [Spirochaetia bacterium 38H-sp]|uniref:RidA family protein n=1 Tax=Rarispira pelagica TaxID=3141764 RepID=A0ABU9UBT3_9SPIR
MRKIHTKNAPEAIGPYSQAIKIGNTLYCSGQIGISPETGKIKNTTIEEEATQTLENLKTVIEAAGFAITDTVKCTIYLTNMSDFSKINEIYASYFSHKPARSTVAVKELPAGARVEIDCIAVKND